MLYNYIVLGVCLACLFICPLPELFHFIYDVYYRSNAGRGTETVLQHQSKPSLQIQLTTLKTIRSESCLLPSVNQTLRRTQNANRSGPQTLHNEHNSNVTTIQKVEMDPGSPEHQILAKDYNSNLMMNQQNDATETNSPDHQSPAKYKPSKSTTPHNMYHETNSPSIGETIEHIRIHIAHTNQTETIYTINHQSRHRAIFVAERDRRDQNKINSQNTQETTIYHQSGNLPIGCVQSQQRNGIITQTERRDKKKNYI
jgi:hypothetical protein